MSSTVAHGDAFELLPQLDAGSAHAVVVDYPWEFEIQNGTGRFEYRGTAEQAPGGERCRERGHDDEMYAQEPADRLPALFEALARVLVDGAWVLCFADDSFQDPLREALRDSPLILRRNWCWTPESMGMGYYGRVEHYPIPVATNGETDRYVRGRGTLYAVGGGRQTDYPTGKPLELYRRLLAPPVLADGERLLEPFCGAAPGGVVADVRGCEYWGCDVDAEAVARARQRIAQPRISGGGEA